MGGGQYLLGVDTIELLLLPLDQLDQVFSPIVNEHILAAKAVENELQRDRGSKGFGQSGRPRKWDWDWMYVEVVILANEPNGLPTDLATLEDWVAQKFTDKFGEAPSESHIRGKLAPIYQALRRART